MTSGRARSVRLPLRASALLARPPSSARPARGRWRRCCCSRVRSACSGLCVETTRYSFELAGPDLTGEVDVRQPTSGRQRAGEQPVHAATAAGRAPRHQPEGRAVDTAGHPKIGLWTNDGPRGTPRTVRHTMLGARADEAGVPRPPKGAQEGRERTPRPRREPWTPPGRRARRASGRAGRAAAGSPPAHAARSTRRWRAGLPWTTSATP